MSTQEDDVVSEVISILNAQGYSRLDETNGLVWESKLNRVQLSTPPGMLHYRYLVLRQHYELSQLGDRVLLARQPPIPIEAEATPKRLADIIKSELENPY